MSTSKKHLEQLASLRYTYEEIDAQVYAVDGGWTSQRLTMPTQAELLHDLAKIWRAVRPILTVVATLPLLRPAWRDAVQFFLTTIEQIVATIPDAGADFKAGKDL
jgi:hypothetical protein